VVSGAAAGQASRLFVQDVAGGEPRPISGDGVRLTPYVPRVASLDGRFVTAIGPDGKAALYPIEGGEPKPITGLGEDLIPSGFSERPGVLYGRSRGQGREAAIYRIDLATGERQLLRKLVVADPSGAPAIATITVSADGKSHAYTEVRTDGELYLVDGVF